MADVAGPEPKGESVSALLEITERIVDDERTRGANLTTKTSTLAGFSGTILAVVAVLGREMFKLNLGTLGSPLVAVLFIISVAALAAAVALAIIGVLRPQLRLAIQTEQVRQFAGPPWTSASPVEIKGNMLASLAKSLEMERDLNDAKARLSDHAARALLVGLLSVAGQAIVLAVDEL